MEQIQESSTSDATPGGGRGTSTTSTAFQETTHRQAAQEDHPYHDLFLQRQRNACVDIHSANGHTQLRPTMGNLMGDRFVPCAFVLTHRRSRYTTGRLARSVVARRLQNCRGSKIHQAPPTIHSRSSRQSEVCPPCRDQPELYPIT